MALTEIKKKVQRFLLYPILGKTYLQWFWRPLRVLATKGMHFGGGSVFEKSGESEVLGRIREKAKSPCVIFDVGANIGAYSVTAAQLFSDFKGSVRIYAFEPSPSTFASLQRSASAHPCISCHNMALSSTNGTAVLYFNELFSVTSSLHRGNLTNFGLSIDAEQQVTTRTLDSFCQDHGIEAIDFLKLDVEGHELEVLKGASIMLARKAIRSLQFEIGRTNIDSRTYFKDYYDLLNKDFAIYRILKNGLYTVSSYSEMDEVFMTTNYFAELK